MKKYGKLFLLILALIILTMKLPYRSYSLSQLLIPPLYMPTSNLAIYFNGILQLIVLAMIVDEYIKLQLKTSKYIVIFIILFLLSPVTSNLQSAVYKLHDGVKAIEIAKNHIFIFDVEDDILIKMKFELESSEISEEDVSIYIEIPEIVLEAYEISSSLEKKISFSNNSEININYEVELVAKNPNVDLDLNLIKKIFRSYKIILKQGDEEAKWHLRKFQ